MSEISVLDESSAVQSPCFMVGVGTSRDCVAVVAEVINDLGVDFPFAVVVAPSAAGSGEALRLAGLQSSVKLVVLSEDEPVAPQPGTVYVPPAQRGVELHNGMLSTVELGAKKHAAPIDHFFASLAAELRSNAVGVILAGSGTDGTLGLKAIGDAGGMTIAQQPTSASDRSMPESATSLGVVDHTLSPDQIAAELLHHAEHMTMSNEQEVQGELNRQILLAIPAIAAAIEKHTENDFKHYKTTTLARRIRRRIQILKLPSVEAYVELLQSSREESVRLFRDLLISVTEFFRDPDAFASLDSYAISKLVEQNDGATPIRVWITGCATGQEAYSIAILIHEASLRYGKSPAVQIFATDLDEQALAAARSGGFPIGIQDEITSHRLKTYFVKRGNRYFVTKTIRDMIVFSAHNLISDPPFTKVDLVSCRNLLIYLGSHLQKKLIPLFHYSLRAGGYLFLGPAETLSVNKELFRTLHVKHRIYQRRITALDRPRSLDLPALSRTRVPSLEARYQDVDLYRFAQQIVLGEFAPQWAVVDDEGQIHELSSDPSPFLKMAAGTFKNNIVSLAHENLRIGLRAAFSQAIKTRRRSLAEDMSMPVDNGIQRVHITVQPMPEMGSESGLHLVAFHRIGTPLRIDPELSGYTLDGAATRLRDQADRVIEQLELELATTRETLERTLQELEASNEELKSSNEELLSMNEELQSANEELETSKDQLQASNESLRTSNNDVENLMRSINIATAFLDENLCLRSFTPSFTAIYDLRPADIGRPITRFVPLVENLPPLPDPKSLQPGDVVEHTVVANSGKAYIRRVMPYQSPSGDPEGIAVTFNDVTELRSSRELFELLVDASSQIVWLTNAEGRVVDDSPSWRSFTGQTVEEWKGHGWLKVIHPDDRESIMEVWDECVRKGVPLTHEYRLWHHSGVYRWTQVRAVPQRLPDNSIRRWVGMNIDITERKRWESELIDREAHLRRVINNQLGLVGVIGTDGTLLEVDDRSLSIAGLTREDVVGKHFANCPWWTYDATLANEMRDAMERAFTGEVVRFDVGLYSTTGTPLMIDFMLAPVHDQHGEIEFLIPSGVDISDRYAAEQQARIASAKLRVLFDNVFYYTGILDLDGNLLDINESALKPFGISRESMVGLPFWETHWWRDQPDSQAKLRQNFAVALRGETYREELPYFTPDGSLGYSDFVYTPALDEHGNVLFVVCTGSDMTERHQFEKSLAEARELAIAANQSKSQFLANMSHEIRTPMTAILGYAELIAERVVDDEVLEHIHTIQRNAGFLLEIINDILDLSKIEAGKFEVEAVMFSPRQLIEELSSLMSVRAFETGLHLEVEYVEPIPAKIKSDPIRLRQILINLTGNAIKFTESGSVKLVVRYDSTSSHLHIDVIDTGTGMSDDQQQKLFKPFEQGDASIVRKYGGTGLGLAISQRLAELLNGRIDVESQLGHGSRFTLTIRCDDLHDSHVTASEILTTSNEPTSHATDSGLLALSVLIVDDRRDIRFLSQHLVEQLGGKVMTAEDGEQAIAVITSEAKAGREFDVVLMDVQMPKMDGFTAVRELRKNGFRQPIIALTANAMNSDREECLRAGYTHYLSKPIDRTALTLVLREIGGASN